MQVKNGGQPDKKASGELRGATIERRNFLRSAAVGMLGMTTMGMFACSPTIAEDNEEGDAAEAQSMTTVISKPSGDRYTLEELNAFRKELVDSKTEYICEDGTIIPEAFVKVRTLIDTYGNGVGSEVTDASFGQVMFNFSEEEALQYIQMPYGVVFTAADFAASSNQDESMCLELCEDLAARGLLTRMRRGGVAYFHQNAEAHGIWEYTLLQNATPEYVELHKAQWGEDRRAQLFNAETPFYYAIPVNKEVIAEEEILPYDDYKKIVARNSIIAVSDCQCRLSHEAIGTEDPGSHSMETCITTGEQAEYYIENGIGRQIDQAEALQILERSVEEGMVLQSSWTKNSEVICSCHGDCCDILGAYVALQEKGVFTDFNIGLNVSHYNLQYDKDACIQCGSCEARCPLFTVSMGDDGYPQTGPNCVRCGQCATVCPASARVLVAKEEIPELPQSLLDDYNLKGEYRMRNNMIY